MRLVLLDASPTDETERTQEAAVDCCVVHAGGSGRDFIIPVKKRGRLWAASRSSRRRRIWNVLLPSRSRKSPPAGRVVTDAVGPSGASLLFFFLKNKGILKSWCLSSTCLSTPFWESEKGVGTFLIVPAREIPPPLVPYFDNEVLLWWFRRREGIIRFVSCLLAFLRLGGSALLFYIAIVRVGRRRRRLGEFGIFFLRIFFYEKGILWSLNRGGKSKSNASLS